MTTKFITVHLFGGPLDGFMDKEVPEHASGLVTVLSGCYTYCPHATAHFTALRAEHTPTFIHETIEHDFFHPSLKSGEE